MGTAPAAPGPRPPTLRRSATTVEPLPSNTAPAPLAKAGSKQSLIPPDAESKRSSIPSFYNAATIVSRVAGLYSREGPDREPVVDWGQCLQRVQETFSCMPVFSSTCYMVASSIVEPMQEGMHIVFPGQGPGRFALASGFVHEPAPSSVGPAVMHPITCQHHPTPHAPPLLPSPPSLSHSHAGPVGPREVRGRSALVFVQEALMLLGEPADHFVHAFSL